MSNQPIRRGRYIVFKLIGFSITACLLFAAAAYLSTAFLSEQEQMTVLRTMGQVPTSDSFDVVHHYGSLMYKAMIAAIIAVIGQFLLIAVAFPEMARTPAQKQTIFLVSPRVFWGVILPAFAAIVVSFIFCPAGRWRLAVGAVVFVLGRVKALRWMAESGGRPIAEFDVSYLNEENGNTDSAPTVTLDEYSGLRTRIIQLARNAQPGDKPKPCYIAQVETSNRNLKLIIQKGEKTDDHGYTPVIANNTGGMIGWYKIVSNDPQQAGSFISTNTRIIEQIMEWATCLSVNVPLNEPMIQDETPFKGAGVLTLVRDNFDEEEYFAMVDMLDALTELANGLSTMSGKTGEDI